MSALGFQGQPGDNQSNDFKGASVPYRVGFLFDKLQPPQGIYVQRDDVLAVAFFTSRTGGDSVNLAVRLLTPSREAGRTQPDAATVDNALGDSPYGAIWELQDQITTTALYTQKTAFYTLQEGFLLSVAASATGAITSGVTFCRIFLVRGGQTLTSNSMVLFSDYVTAFQAMGWPGANQTLPTQGIGQLKTYTVANPAAGAEWTFTPVSGTRIRVRSVMASFTASATVANRFPTIQIRENVAGLNCGQYPSSFAVTATTVATVSAGSGVSTPTALSNCVTISLPDDTFIGQNSNTNFQLRTLTGNIQVGDQWSNIVIFGEEWLDV